VRCVKPQYWIHRQDGSTKSGLDVHHVPPYLQGAKKKFSVGSLEAPRSKDEGVQRAWLARIAHFNAPAHVRLLCQKHHQSGTHTPPGETGRTVVRPADYSAP
jgi:hypothetical protein